MQETWNEYGYGINVSAINKPDTARFKSFIESAPGVKEYVMKAWTELKQSEDLDETLIPASYDKANFDDICAMFDSDNYNTGLAEIIKMVIRERKGIPVNAPQDTGTDEYFVIMPPVFPWDIDDTILKIKTPDDVKSMFAECLELLTDQPINDMQWYDHSVCGWG